MKKNILKKPIAVDLFCGAGGLSLGLKRAGFNILAAIDSDESVCLTFKKNHKGTEVINADISKLTVNGLLGRLNISKSKVALVAGGPPCQGFSMANGRTRTKNNPKNRMVNHFVRFVKEIQPPLFLMENVLGFKSINEGRVVRNLKTRFSKLGYKTSLFTLNAAYYGVPQNRLRVFLIGNRKGKEFKIPPQRYGNNSDNPLVTVRDALLGDLPKLIPPGNNVCKYADSPITAYQLKIRGKTRYLYNHVATRNNKTVQKRKAFVPIGGNWRNVPKKFCDIKVQFSATYKRLNPDEPSITVSNFRKSMLIHPYENRGLSVREAARLQSFPDSYIFYGGISSMQQQVGDAVPPPLAKAVGKQLIDLLV